MKEIDELLAESKALESALEVVEAGVDPEKAKGMALSYRCAYQQPNTPLGYATDVALQLIYDGVVLDIPNADNPEGGSWHQRAIAMACFSWIGWAVRGDQKSIEFALKQLRGEISSEKSAIEAMTLDHWGTAIEHLVANRMGDARKSYQRAITLGSHYGATSNPVVQWTYAASFFPR